MGGSPRVLLVPGSLALQRARQVLEATEDAGKEVTVKISEDADRLLRWVREHPLDKCLLEELAHDLSISKTAVAHALKELERVGLVSLYVEEED